MPNAQKKYAVGSAHGLVREPDGAVVIRVQSASPGLGREANWLPSPTTGRIILTGRYYAPRRDLLEGRWAPPKVTRVFAAATAKM